MHFQKGFSLAQKFYPLVLLAIVLDLFKLGDVVRRVQEFNVRFTVPQAVPSLAQVLADSPQSAGSGLNINMPYDYLGAVSILLFVLFFMLTSYLKGGFLGCVLDGLEGHEFKLETFFSHARYYFVRFLFQSLLVFLIFIMIMPFVIILFPVFLIAFLVVFFFLVFWDYIIVAEDVMVIDAARSSWNLVAPSAGKVFSFLLPAVIATALFSFLANAMVPASPALAAMAIVIYAYLGTAVVFAVMSFYLELRETEGAKTD